jgi:hypothetical protein
MKQRGVEQFQYEVRKIARVGGDFAAEGFERHVGRSEDQERAQEDQIQEVDHDQGEERAVGGEVGLTLGDHPKGKAEVEGPGQSEQAEEDRSVRLQIVEDAGDSVGCDDDDRVERPEVGSEGDPEIRFIRDYVAAIARGLEVEDLSAHGLRHDGVGQFMAENVDTQGAGFTVNPEGAGKCDRPENRAEREVPEFFRGPERVMPGGVGETGEQRLGQHPRGGEQEKSDYVVEPAGWNSRMSPCFRRGPPSEEEAATGFLVFRWGLAGGGHALDGCV